jgi:hypothetical protein
MISIKLMKQAIGVDNPERPRGSVNCRCTASSGRANALPRNLITVPRAGFTTAKVQRSRSPVSSCTSRSRASKLGTTQHHSRVVKEREEEENGEKDFIVCYSGDPPSLL